MIILIFPIFSQKLMTQGYEPIESSYLNDLKTTERLLESPSKAYLVSKCKAAKLSAIPEEELTLLREVKTDHEKPSSEYLTEKKLMS